MIKPAHCVSILLRHTLTALCLCATILATGCSESKPTHNPLIHDGESLNHGTKLVVSAADGHFQNPTPEGTEEMTATLNFVAGVTQMAQYVQHLDPKQPYKIPKEGVSSVQAARIVDRFLSAHPELLDRPAAQLVALALVDAYPNN